MLHDKPLSEAEDDKAENTENLSASELRKLKNKQKKQQVKAQAEKEKQAQMEQKKKELSKQKAKDGDGDVETINEDDLMPDKLERPENPLEECSRFLKPLEEFAVKRMETHILAFEVYSRKEKYILMLRSLKRMKKIFDNDAQNNEYRAKFHYYLATFLTKFNKAKAGLNETIIKVIELEIPTLYNGRPVEELIETFIKENGSDFYSIIEGKVSFLTRLSML